MRSFDQHLFWLSEQQHGIVGRTQLLEKGTPRQIDHRLATGILVIQHQSVYRVTAVAPSWRQELMAATMAGGKQSVVSGRAAAQLLGLPGGSETVEITSPRHRRSRHAGVIPHESYFLNDRDIRYVDNIPVTRPARTLCDLGYLVTTRGIDDATLDLALLEAYRRNLIDLRALWTEWERLGGLRRPGGEVIERLLRRFVPPVRPVDSTGEARLLQLVRAAGLPEPVPQYRVWWSESRWYDLDLAWPAPKRYAEFDPYKWHGDRARHMRDATRTLRLQGLGWHGVSVTDDELDAGAPLALAVLTTALRGDASLNHTICGSATHVG